MSSVTEVAVNVGPTVQAVATEMAPAITTVVVSAKDTVSSAQLDGAIRAHVEDKSPHPAYDLDIPDLSLIFDNHLL